MAELRMKSRDRSERILVLATDIDNDLYRKAGISGPVMGRVQNLNAANQLVLADPEDTDSNAIFQAVKIYDNLKKDGYIVSLATITGSENEGLDADREISRQLDLVLKEYKADSCVFVSDGASDDRVLPIVESRVKINGVKHVTMKQAEKLENTYFVILEKLKEPHYARIVFGIPAILILLFAISYAVGTGWELPVGIIGVYLVLKGFGIETFIINSFKGFGFSIDRMSFAFYLTSIIFFIASVFIGYSNYLSQIQLNFGNAWLAYAYGIEGFLLLLPLTLAIYLVGRIIDVNAGKYIFRSFKYGNYIASSIIFWIILYSFIAWIIGSIYFSQLIDYMIAAMAIGFAVSRLTAYMKRRTMKSKRMVNKLVINELGAMIGKISGMDSRQGLIRISTSFGNDIVYSMDRIVDVSDKVIVR